MCGQPPGSERERTRGSGLEVVDGREQRNSQKIAPKSKRPITGCETALGPLGIAHMRPGDGGNAQEQGWKRSVSEVVKMCSAYIHFGLGTRFDPSSAQIPPNALGFDSGPVRTHIQFLSWHKTAYPGFRIDKHLAV